MALNTIQTGLPADTTRLLHEVDGLLAQNRPADAMDRLRRSSLSSPWLANAAGVCQLRLGNPAAAIALFRPLAVVQGLFLRQDASPVFLVNFAEALIAEGNFSGGIRTLDEIRDREHPVVAEARETVRNWNDKMTFWQRLWWMLGGSPPSPLVLRMQPGLLC